MSARVALLVSLIVAVGCRNEVVKKDGDALKCDPVIGGLVARLHTDTRGDHELDDVRSNYKAVLSNRCTEDKWTAGALACIQAATSDAEFESCQYKNLSQEQQDKLRRATATASVSFGPKNEPPGDLQPPEQANDVDEVMTAMTSFADKMCGCKDKACADNTQDEMNKWSVAMGKSGRNQERPNEARMKQMSEVGTRYGECMSRAMTDPTTAAVRPPPRNSAPLPPECGEYRIEIDLIAGCEKVPQATRDALKQSYEQTSAAWASVPPEGRAALGTACKAAADAVRQSGAACGSNRLLKECRRYEVAIARLASCDRLPAATRDVLWQSYEETVAAWSSVPPEGRKALAKACTAAAVEVEQSAAACE